MTTATPPTPEAPASAGAFVLHPKEYAMKTVVYRVPEKNILEVRA